MAALSALGCIVYALMALLIGSAVQSNLGSCYERIDQLVSAAGAIFVQQSVVIVGDGHRHPGTPIKQR